MSNVWIECSFGSTDDAETRTAKKEAVLGIIKSKARTLKEASEEGRVGCGDVKCECGEAFPWKILTDNDCDLTEFARGLRNDISEILDPESVRVTVNVS